jgi:hypothetical protein
MREPLVSAFEQLTGRKVIAFMRDNHIDPDFRQRLSCWSPRSMTTKVPNATRLLGSPGRHGERLRNTRESLPSLSRPAKTGKSSERHGSLTLSYHFRSRQNQLLDAAKGEMNCPRP